MLPKITIVSASVGAGHDGAARELARRLAGRGFDVAVLDFLDLLPGRLGPMVRHAYATELAVAPSSWGWLLRGLGHQRAAKTVAALAVWAAGRATLAALGTNPAVVVSTYPLASQVLGRLRREGSLTAPVVTFLTDLSVHPLWVADGVDLHLAIHEVAARQAAGHGARVRVAGPAVAPAFHPDLVFADGSSNHSGVMVERRRTRFHYGVPADRPAALVVAGSWGIGEIEHTMRDIAASGLAVPVALCGNNEPLRHRLVRAGHGPALGWVDDPAPLIRACDVVVQNAGGLTSLEALACDRPVISYRCLAGHGTTNAAALHEAGLAVWASDRSELDRALADAIRVPSSTMLHSGAGTVGRARRFGEADDPARHIAELAGAPRDGLLTAASADLAVAWPIVRQRSDGPAGSSRSARRARPVGAAS